MKPWLQWTIGGLFVVAAWLVAFATPPENAREAPFPVPAEIGQEATGRNIQLTVTDIVRTDRVVAGDWSAEGDWLVVDLDVEAVQQERGTALRVATLDVDGRTFSASERPESLADELLTVGIPQSGSVAFELPEGIDATSAVLTFGESLDPRLDSVIVLDLDLDEVPHRGEVELQETTWTNG